MIGYDRTILKIAERLVSVVVCYFLAKRQNRNIGIAIALGMAFGVLALVYYLVISAKRSHSEGADYVKCKECGEIFVDSKKFCPGCKREANYKTFEKVR